MKLIYAVRTMAAVGILTALLTQRGAAFTQLARWHSDEKYHYLESNGLPTHKMRVGITAWQQQFPLPQDFTGGNAFRIPRNPVMAANPISAKSALFSGAIAVAVNGVPIFNPIKNDGVTDTLLAGELDEFGGHCGRADDYHYHIAPLHLVDTVGVANPIGYALDGFALYGLTDPDGTTPKDLDSFNGHTVNGVYHYHATKTYPYVNGGLRGVVQVVNDAITPQPQTFPIRPAGDPLRGAKIVGFTWPGPNKYSLEYELTGRRYFVNYQMNADGSYTFTNVDPGGASTSQTYQRPAANPALYTVNSTGLATGYVTRVNGSQQTTEQFVQRTGNAASALPIDVANGQVYLILYGSNLGANANGTATVGGVSTQLAYAGPLTPFNGVAQYNILVPPSLVGAGKVDVSVTIANRASNTVNVTIR